MQEIIKPDGRRIRIAEIAGACFGVRRALNLAEAARRENDGEVAVLGLLVHNQQVVDDLQSRGIGTVQAVSEMSQGTLVLSAHGVSPQVKRSAEQTGLRVVDATCPFVTKVHRAAKTLYDQGYQVLIVGDRGHTEVKGVLGTVCGNAAVITDVRDLDEITITRKVGVVSQTTQRTETFAAVVAAVAGRADDVRAINTVCNATEELQASAAQLAAGCDVVLVVGGARSANSNRLRDLCIQNGARAYRIETPDEIETAWLQDAEVIGVTAGASTPDRQIEAVVRWLNDGHLPEDFSLHHPDE